MVEATGLEPAASWSQTKHSTKLSYASISFRCRRSFLTTFVIIAPLFDSVNTFFKVFSKKFFASFFGLFMRKTRAIVFGLKVKTKKIFKKYF